MRRWLLLLLALTVVGGTAGAQDRLAAARREGKVVWHTALAAESAQRVAARFEQAYPGIRVEVPRTGSERILYNERRKGSPIGAAYPRDGVVLITSPSAIMSFAPHPNAARLFTDFIFTRDIQQLLADSEGLYAARRTDEVKKRFVDLFGA